jgi:hypothetical protein
MAGIPDGQLHVWARLQIPTTIRGIGLKPDFFKGHLQYPSTLAHGMSGIGAKVHQYLMDLSRIRQHHRAGNHIHFDLDC